MSSTLFIFITCIAYTCNATNWMHEYYTKFYANDTERWSLIQMDDTMYKWTESKSGIMFSGVFTNNTVLQREPKYASLYGTCDTPNTSIVLTIKDKTIQTYSTTSMENGDWKISLPQTYENGGNYTLTAHCNKCMAEPRNVTIYNMTFGDVYLCMGQSNMKLEIEFTFNGKYTRDNITKLGKYSNIRFYYKRRTATSDHVSTFVIPREYGFNNNAYQWYMGSNVDRVNRFSAACWYTAQSLVDMYNMSDVNFGLILSAIGGSQIESWIQNDTIDSSDCAYTNNDCPGEKCGTLYNGMLSPFVNMSIKGILWNQGENNVKQQRRNYSSVSPYSCLEKLMIEQYRNLWNDTYLPFGIFQLPAGTSEGYELEMPYFRQAQTGNYGILPNEEMRKVFLAQGYDLGDPWRMFKGDINYGLRSLPYNLNTTKWLKGPVHGRPKLYLAQRMAMNLNKFVYNNDGIWNGPLLKGCELNMNEKIITVDFNENMLYDEKVIIQPLSLWYNESLVDKVRHWSAIKLLVNGTWRDLDGMDVFSVDDNGYSININVSNVFDSHRGHDIKGISYAWSEFPCCGDLNQHYHPCPMNMCPIITSKSRLPVIPFQAEIVNNKCQCFEPQTCDGSNYVIPGDMGKVTASFTTIMPTPEPTKRPTRGPTDDTWILNECNVIIPQSHLLSSKRVMVYFKWLHPRKTMVAEPSITFIVNGIEVTTTQKRYEFVDLLQSEVDAAMMMDKFEARLSFKDDDGYSITQNNIKCSYISQQPTASIDTDIVNDPDMEGNDKNNLNVTVSFDNITSFTVFSIFSLCIVINGTIIGCYYCMKKTRI